MWKFFLRMGQHSFQSMSCQIFRQSLCCIDVDADSIRGMSIQDGEVAGHYQVFLSLEDVTSQLDIMSTAEDNHR